MTDGPSGDSSKANIELWGKSGIAVILFFNVKRSAGLCTREIQCRIMRWDYWEFQNVVIAMLLSLLVVFITVEWQEEEREKAKLDKFKCSSMMKCYSIIISQCIKKCKQICDGATTRQKQSCKERFESKT